MAERRHRVAGSAAQVPDWLHDGVEVDYHSIIDGPITGRFKVEGEPYRLNGERWVVWLHGKSGCVSVEALTKVPA